MSLEVSAGLRFTCALRDGAAWCWGKNLCGELGSCRSPFSPPQAAPVRVELDERVVQLDANWHACAVVESGSVFWGSNSSDQLGGGGRGCHVCPSEVPGVQARKVSAGITHTCAALLDGGVACWGNNEYGQLGDGTREARISPTRIALEDVHGISAGGSHTLRASRRWRGELLGSQQRGTDRRWDLRGSAQPVSGARHHSRERCECTAGERTTWANAAHARAESHSRSRPLVAER